MPPARLRALDAIRGLAALGVVAFHLGRRYPDFMAGRATPLFEVWDDQVLDIGRLPVLWFFLLSGFVITWSIERSAGPMDFVVSRVSRIYPAYWASIALTVTVAALWPLPGVALGWGQVLVNLTMLQAYAMVPDVAAVYWSLAVEILFYLYALAVFAAGLWRWVHVAALLWACLAFAAAVLAATGDPLSWWLNRMLLLDSAPFLVSGMMLYRVWRRQHLTWSAATLALCAVTVAFMFEPLTALGGIAAAASVACAAEGRLRWLEWPPLLWLGSISYSLYLVHELPSYAAIRTLDGQGLPHLVSVAGALCLALATATAITFAIERPAMHAIRGAWRRRTQGTAPSIA